MKSIRTPYQRLCAGLTLCAFFLCGVLQPLLVFPASARAFTVGEEREVGEKLLSIVRKEFNLIDDPDITEYITLLGRQTLQLAGAQYFDYHFFVIDNKEFNAFAAPSGLIFFHSGLVDLCASEGELVSVLAHEIGHAASRHIADRISKSGKVNAGTTALMLAGLLIGGGALSQALITGSMAGGAMANLKFSREDEEEADRLAYKWMTAQERDPQEMVNMLKKMRRVSRYHRNQVPTYLLTHPEPENRIGYIEDKILQDPPANYDTQEEFAFTRFKYRVQTLSRQTQSILPILKKKAAEPDTLRENPMLFYGLALAHLQNLDYAKAEENLRKVIARYPEKQILKTDLGRIKLEAGETETALALFQQVNKAVPYSIYNSFYLAKALQQAGQQAQAVLIYEGLLEQLPTYPKLYYEIGRLRAALGNQALGHYNLGVYHFYQGSAATARFHLEQAARELSPADPLLAKIMAMQKKMERLEKL